MSEGRIVADGMDGGFGRFGSGQAVRRIEDGPLLRGAGSFSDDISLPGQTHMVFLRSPHAHARIVSIDTTEAKAMPGVLAVLTGADLEAAGVGRLGIALPFKRPDGSPRRRAAAAGAGGGRVRLRRRGRGRRGRPRRMGAARDGAEAVVVDYEELPAVTSAAAAAAPGAPQVWPAATGNIVGADAARRPRRGRCRLRAPPRMSSRSTSSTSAWRRSRWSRARCSPPTMPATDRITLR